MSGLPFRREVHEVPVRPHRVDMVRNRFGSPEMENLTVLFPEYMHHWPLHVIGLALAFVIGLKWRVMAGHQRNL